MTCRRFLISALAAMLGLCLGTSAAARGLDDGELYYGDAPITDFTLRLSREETTLDYGSQSYRTTIRKIGVDWAEGLMPRLYGTLHAGYLEIDQSANPALAGLSPNGYYAGIGLRAMLLQSQVFTTTLGAHYLYHQVSTSATSQDVELSWDDSGADVAMTLRASPRLSLTGGVGYGQGSGEERQSGTVNLTRHFDQDRHVNYFAVLGLHVDRGGAIRLAYQRGRYEGAWLSFSRTF